MKKVLVAFAVVALFAACNDNASSTEGEKKDSVTTTTPAGGDTTKPAGGDTAKATAPAAGDTAKKAETPAAPAAGDTAKKAK